MALNGENSTTCKAGNGAAGRGHSKFHGDMKNLADILTKKRSGQELTGEEVEYFIKETALSTGRDGQLGAFLTALDIKGCSDVEAEHMMKVMATSSERLEWPEHWLEKIASLQSIGYTGNKAKPIVAPAMAACGLKFPIMSSRGIDVFGSIMRKMATLPGFIGSKSWDDLRHQLSKVGCCIVQQPENVGPGETTVRNMSSQVGVNKNRMLKAACLMARICAMNLHAVVLTITYGHSESITTEEEARDLVQKLQRLATCIQAKCHVLLLKVESPVGKMIGQSLEVAEVVKCLNGEGPADLHELVCKLGGHILVTAGKAENPEDGYKMVDAVLKDGSAKKKFMDMLVAQGVEKHDVKLLFKHLKHEEELPIVLPAAQYFTHLSTDNEGYVTRIDTEICSKVMFDLAYVPDSSKPSSGGIQLLVHVGSRVKKGECWARLHHNKRLTEDQVDKLKSAITLQDEAPTYEMKIDMQEIS